MAVDAITMDVLVIGKTGQLGQALIEHAPSDWTVAAPGADELDITHPEQVVAAIERVQPQIVINTAAYNRVPDCEESPDAAFQLNAFAPWQMARECGRRSIRFVTYSTDYVFDGAATAPYTEESAPHPIQMYGVSKYAGELACLNVHPDAVVIRTSGLYGGLTGSPAKGNFVLSMLQKASSGEHAIEVGRLQTSTPTYASDLAVATIALLQQPTAGGIYHLTNSGHCSWAEFAQEIVQYRKLALQIIPVDTVITAAASPTLPAHLTLQRPVYTVLANTRARALGIELPDWHTALHSYLDWLTTHATEDIFISS